MPSATHPSESLRCPGPRSPGHLQAGERRIRTRYLLSTYWVSGKVWGTWHVMGQVIKAENCCLSPCLGRLAGKSPLRSLHQRGHGPRPHTLGT